MRLTIACPEAAIGDANQLARCLGFGPDDDKTFGAAWLLDANGSRYAAASFEADQAWFAALEAPLMMPDWGCDLAAAARARAQLRIWFPDSGTPPPVAATGLIVAQADLAPAAALTAMGLRPPASQN